MSNSCLLRLLRDYEPSDGTFSSTRGQGHWSPEQLVVEHAGLVAGPVVLELRDVVVEGAEGVSAHQQRRALPPAQPEVLPAE